MSKLKTLSLASLALLPLLAQAQDSAPQMDSGDTAWMLTSSVLVLFMTVPGLALFYAGMSRKKNLLSTMMYSFGITCVVSILWVLFGYSLAFTDGGSMNKWIGGTSNFFMKGITIDNLNGGTFAETIFVFFQMTFAIISTAIASGAFVGRMKFSAAMLFSALFMLLVYVPVAHWVWGGGFLADAGIMDFAGGTVVHINAGVAGLAAAIVVGKRIGYQKEQMPPYNLAYTLIGAAMLWVGWFGFNAGSAAAANDAAGMAALVTQIATAAAALTWISCEMLSKHKPSALGLASGAVAGLVGITPASGYVGPMGALAVGIITAIFCYLASVVIKNKLGYDDSLDAFGVHGVGGIVGSVLTGVFASTAIVGADGVTANALQQFGYAMITVVYAFVVSVILLLITKVICGGLRVTETQEQEGLDLNLHGERLE